MDNFQKNIQEIYCDESGFTGGNLLDEDTPFFAYATVAVSHEEAKEFVSGVMRDYKVQTSELKFQKLIKYSRGRQAITHILKTFTPRAKVSVNHKKYNLACKFYEYIFEPAIASKSSIFYAMDFHKFISHLLYFHFEQKSEYASAIFDDFYNLMKAKDDDGLLYLFGSPDLPNISAELRTIMMFCMSQRGTINAELDSLKGTGVGKWILDLTNSALVALLSEWGKEYDQLCVFCDSSKPLQDQVEIYQAMVNREEKLFLDLGKRECAVTFNLDKPPLLVNSISHPGIQIADILAGTFAFVLRENSKGNHNSYPNEWKHYLVNCGSDFSVVPDFDHLDLNDIHVRRNFLLLSELTRRSVEKSPLLDGIELFLESIS